jgi:aspartyl/asparaginyl beta-hydroxylase (cupin superfamily)
MCRADGDPRAALDAVEGALAVDPLGFMPLLLKASLLDAIGESAQAGAHFGYALAQAPETIPPSLGPMVTEARRAHAAHVARVAARLADAAATVADDLLPRERRRIERFRTNIAERAPAYHSEPTHFRYPGLCEREFHDPEDFPWLAELEAATDRIAEDFHRVMAAERAELVPYIQYPKSAPVRQWEALNHNRAWTAIHLVRNGRTIDANARHCPATMALLPHLDPAAIPGHGPNAMFSLLAPGAHIPPHHGVSNARLVCHLPLIVPSGCWFRVGAERRDWARGQAWVFDDTIEHEAMNPSEALRVILIVDTWHPDLSTAERAAVSVVVAASA